MAENIRGESLGATAKRISEHLGSYLETSPLSRVAKSIRKLGWPAVILGGSLRDLAFSDLSPRDIDIVVDSSGIEVLLSEFDGFLLRRTRFGGFRFDISGWVFDIWDLKATWAFKAGIVGPPTFANLPKTTFLDVEAIAIDLLPQRGRERRIFAYGFFEALARQVVEVNLEENPFPDLCVVRALLTAARLDFAIGPGLRRYILRHASHLSAATIEEIQRNHYGDLKWDSQELSGWVDFIRQRSGEESHPLRLPIARDDLQELRQRWIRRATA